MDDINWNLVIKIYQRVTGVNYALLSSSFSMNVLAVIVFKDTAV